MWKYDQYQFGYEEVVEKYPFGLFSLYLRLNDKTC